MADPCPIANSSSRPPLLLGSENYSWWKGRMQSHLERDPMEWRVTERGPFQPPIDPKDAEKDKDIDDYTPDELLKLSYNDRAKNTIITGLSITESDRVSACKSDKEIWDSLEQIHEGNKFVKKVWLSNLRNEFGNFKLKEGETIREAHARFQTIMNSLNQLGKPIPPDERNMKILSAIP